MEAKQAKAPDLIEITLPPQIDEQVRSVAKKVGIEVDETVALLGLEAMRERDARLADLTGRFRSERDPVKKTALGDELGQAIFG